MSLLISMMRKMWCCCLKVQTVSFYFNSLPLLSLHHACIFIHHHYATFMAVVQFYDLQKVQVLLSLPISMMRKMWCHCLKVQTVSSYFNSVPLPSPHCTCIFIHHHYATFMAVVQFYDLQKVQVLLSLPISMMRKMWCHCLKVQTVSSYFNRPLAHKG